MQYYTVKTVVTTTAKVATGLLGVELLGASCERAVQRYQRNCENFYSDIHCIFMKSSTIATCGGANFIQALSIKSLCHAVLPSLCKKEK